MNSEASDDGKKVKTNKIYPTTDDDKGLIGKVHPVTDDEFASSREEGHPQGAK